MLLVEHDIDRVFQIADHVTVMNEGKVLVDGTVEMARGDAKVREVYIGSGAATLAAKPRVSAAEATPLLVVDTRHLNLVSKGEDFDELLDQLRRPVRGTEYFTVAGKR